MGTGTSLKVFTHIFNNIQLYWANVALSDRVSEMESLMKEEDMQGVDIH